MATKISFSLVLLALSGISMAIFSIPAAKADGEVTKETKISAYLHDYTSGAGPKATNFPLVGFPGKNWNFTQFGTLFVLDDLITETPKPTSATVGRLQGTYVITSSDGLNYGFSYSLVFANKAYNGSTIQLLGNANQLNPVIELSVASGTGKFRFAKGYAIFETLYSNISTHYTLYRMNVTVCHY